MHATCLRITTASKPSFQRIKTTRKTFTMSSAGRKVSQVTVGLLILGAYFAAGSAYAQKVPQIQSQSFAQDYRASWNPDKVLHRSDGSISLTLDHQGGSGFTSTKMYTFGYVSTAIRLVAGDSSGIVTTYYLSSDTTNGNHDELDFEFLGNKSGQPYILQTNVFANGVGGREQRIYLWFDPSADYHKYSVIWNIHIIIFSVDDIPIRVFKNNEQMGIDFLKSRPMAIISTIWNGEKWATRGGQDKVDWTHAPFAASYKAFTIDGCLGSSGCATASKWWAQPQYQALDRNLQTELAMVKRTYMIYDYCTDSHRNPVAPRECATN